jgi:cytoplasmic iron level regulating protein YaaA (DUF328/UPF0246 family)
MNDYKIIISPAKNINETPIRFSFENKVPHFQLQAVTLANRLKRFSAEELSSFMNISPQLALQNAKRFNQWKKSEGQENELIAISAFTGEVFRAFDFNTLSTERYDNLSNKLRILSGLYGVLNPFDLIYPYRLEMGTKLSIGERYKNLYEFWEKPLSEYFKRFLGTSTLINLASNEYSKVLKINKLETKIVTPVFKELKNGKLQAIMMYAKNARGKMARYLIENDIKSVEEIKYFAEDGYRFHESLSNDSDWIFTR